VSSCWWACPHAPGNSARPAGSTLHGVAEVAGFLAADSPASSALTRELMGWQPS
jgi:hypothetical protein